MNLEAIATYLDANNCGLMGKTIFVTEMPASCLDGLVLIGPVKGSKINHQLPGYFVTIFRVVFRGIDYDTVMLLAKKVSRVLTSYGGFTAGDVLARQCLPVNTPRPYRRSVGGYWEVETDVEIVYVDTSA